MRLLAIGILVLLVVSTIVLPVAAAPSEDLKIDHNSGVRAVYTEDNAASNNVWRFAMFSNGTLGSGVPYSAGGSGTGIAFHSQGAIALTDNGRWLLAVDAGSNEITAFLVTPNGLTMTDKVSSHGMMPISVTVQDSLVYVLNSASKNIAGFTLSSSGKLSYLSGSNLSLNSGAASPEQIGFGSKPDGDILVVAEKGSNQIDTYSVDHKGVPKGPITTVSHGNGPYGFAFTNKGDLVDSEAGSGAVSTYDVSKIGTLKVISGSISTTGAGDTPCWVAITDNGRFAYTGNGAAGTVSSYKLAGDGSINLISENAAGGLYSPSLDLAFSKDSDFLYLLSADAGKITGFRVNQANGGLTVVSTVSGLPTSAAGLAAL